MLLRHRLNLLQYSLFVLGEGRANKVNWMRLELGSAPQRCFCGHWFVAKDAAEYYETTPSQRWRLSEDQFILKHQLEKYHPGVNPESKRLLQQLQNEKKNTESA